MVKLLDEAHGEIRRCLERGELDAAARLLGQCQECALRLGTLIEETEGADHAVIPAIRDYCEQAYEDYETITEGRAVHAGRLYKRLHRAAIRIENGIRSGIRVRREVVFLPYKVSMWDSMESVFKAAQKDGQVEAYVVPIPYYEKNPDGTFGKLHYEGGLFPEEIPVTPFAAYSLPDRRPDVIFIHNSYDNTNRVTSVLPAFFSANLKKYTETLAYIPYFAVPGRIPDHFVLTPGVWNADLVFVQNEKTRLQYIDILKRNAFPGGKKRLEEKILAMGTPKKDKLFSCLTDKALKTPEEWERRIGDRRVVFFNTNVSLILNNGPHFVENLYRIFHMFERYRERFVLLWREHPLTMETIRSMRPGLLQEYLEAKELFREREWGILDLTEEPHLAMARSDCYFGAGGSLLTIYSATGRPMMITAYQYPQKPEEGEISKEEFYRSIAHRTYYKEEYSNCLPLFLENYEEIREKQRQRIRDRGIDRLDGTVGEKIYTYTMDRGDRK